ncbi:MAG: DUF1887 family protein [Gemmatimonadetes bacterium]|jgi:hypothetical protein|nr:DUF1887 family protein [Gemmatimonadota bacterium]
MPVLIPTLVFRPVSTQLLVTDGVRSVGENIRDALRTHQDTKTLGCHVHEPIRPYWPEDAAAQSDRIFTGRYNGRRFALNVTGGTTLMALGARRAAAEHNVPLLYVDTDNGVIITLAPDGSVTGEREITVSVPTSTYLAAHSATVSAREPWGKAIERRESWLKPFLEAATVLGQAGGGSERLLDVIRPVCSGGAAGPAELPEVTTAEESLANRLQEFGMIEVARRGGSLQVQPKGDERIRQFLTGHWLELYVYRACLTSGLFDDVCLSVDIRRRTESGTVVNECDVLTTLRGRLAVISCKTARLDHKDENKGAVYELDSLLQAELMGLYARKVLVTNRLALRPPLRNRAGLSQIECIWGPHLPDVAQRIQSCLLPGRR